MDNYKDNTPDSKDPEWLERLLNGTDAPWEQDYTAPATEETKKVPSVGNQAESQDAELERILMENWSDTEPAAEDAPKEVNIFDDDFEFDSLLAADALEKEPEEAAAPIDISEFEPDFFTEEQETEEEQAEPETAAPPRKGRPKRESGYGFLGIPHIISTVIWLVLIVAIGVSLGRTLWVCCADLMAFGKEDRTVSITVTEDDDLDSIAEKLGKADLVRYPNLFKFFAKVTDKADNIGVGTFTLNSQLDYNAMINAMYDYGPEQQVVTLMFPEGYNCAQIFKLLEENGVCTAKALEEYCMQGELKDYWFLEGVSRDFKYCLEGYLAPDTYKFYVDDSPRRVLEKFLDEFDQRFTDLMKEDFEQIKQTYANRLKNKGYSDAYIQEHTLTVHDVVTLASIIQKETASDAESYDIASTFYNRLVANMQLGADATVYYAIGDYFWETEVLTQAHLDTDSPYNTRKNSGIPPRAICNMGVHALYAALEPNDTGYYYFVYDSEKQAHRFAKTEAEHINNLKELGY